MPYTGEETNKKLGALIIVTKELVESREEEKKDASFFDVPSPSGEPGDAVDSEGNKLVLSKAGNLMQAGADGKATVMSPVGATSKIPNIPSMALPRMGDAGRAGQAEDDAEGTTEPDEEKRNSLLSKMTGFLGDQAKEKGKIAKLGLKAFFGTLVFGGFLIALGKFLQSDTFKKVTEFIDKTLIPKLKTFYDAFFGPEGGLFKGIMTLFGDESGIGAIVAGIAVVTALMGVVALKALFSPLTLGLGLLFKGIRGLGRMIPRVPGGPAPRPGTAGGPAGGGPAASPRPRPRRARGRFGNLLNIGKFLASKAKKLVTSGGAKAVAKVAGTAAVGAAALATTRSAAASTVKPPTATAVKPPTPAAGGGGVVDKFKHLSKFPLLKKAATKIPLLGPLLSGAFAVQLLLSDAPKEEKIKGIGGLLGGSLGATGFGIIGGTLGSIVPGFGTVIGGLLGSTLGFFAGDYLGTKVASFLMGEGAEIEKPKVPEGDAGTGMPKASASGAGSSKASPNLKIQAAAKANFQKQASIGKQASSDIAALGKPMTVVGREKDGFREEIMGFKDPEKQAQLEKLQKQQKDAQIKKRQAAQKFAAAEIGGQGGTFKYGGKRTLRSNARKVQLLLERYSVGQLQSIAPEQLTDNYILVGGNRFPMKVLGFYENWLKERLETKPTPAPAAGDPAASGAGDVGTGMPMSMPGDAAPAAGGGAGTGIVKGPVEQKFNTEPARKQLAAAKDKKKAALVKLTDPEGGGGLIKTKFGNITKKQMEMVEEQSRLGGDTSGKYKAELIRNAADQHRFDQSEEGKQYKGTKPDGTMVTKDDPRRVDDSAVAHLPKAERADAKKAIIQSKNINMRMNNLREQANQAGQKAEGAGGGSMTQELALTRQNLLVDEFNKLKAQDDALRKKFPPPPKKANMAQNKVGTQTADLKAAIAKKLAMSGDTSTAAAATQQGGGNTQITNVSKKDGDVTHMPKSDIRNNKFAALNRSAYAAGAI